TLPPPTSTLFPYTTLFRSPPRACRSISSTATSTLRDRPLLSIWACASCTTGNHWPHVLIHALSFSSIRFAPVDLHASIAACKSRSEEHTSELQSRSDLVCR